MHMLHSSPFPVCPTKRSLTPTRWDARGPANLGGKTLRGPSDFPARHPLASQLALPASVWVWSPLLTSLQTSSALCPFLQREQTLTFGEQCPLGAPRTPAGACHVHLPDPCRGWCGLLLPAARVWLQCPLASTFWVSSAHAPLRRIPGGACCPPRPQHRLRPPWRTEVLRAQPPEDARGLFTCLSLRMARSSTHSVLLCQTGETPQLCCFYYLGKIFTFLW